MLLLRLILWFFIGFVAINLRMKRVQSSTSDVISTLQSNIAENILKRLPLRDAVRTSVLSSGWRYKWVTLPELVFDEESFPESVGNRELKTTIYQVLLLHTGPLVKFELRVPGFKSCLDINHWIRVLLKKNIQEFTLWLSPGENHKLPSHLFSLLQIRHLWLSYCIFEPPPTFKGFTRLVELHFANVVVVPKMFGNIISCCPLLECLTLFECTRFDDLEINAANLKCFSFRGIFKSLCFRSTAFLAEISVALSSTQHDEREDSNLIKFFQCLPTIQKLNLEDNMLKFLAVGRLPKRLPNTLNRLETLKLFPISFDKINEVSLAVCLIRSSPNLQKLTIECSTNPVNTEAVTEFLEAQDFSKWPLKKLRKVKIFDFSGAESQILFVKFMLAWSTALEMMEIGFLEPSPSTNEYMLLKKLTRFPRASPKAELDVFE